MPTRNCYPVLIVWAATARAGKSRSYTSNIVPARLAESVWCKKKLQSSLYFLLSGFEPSLLLIYFSDSLNGCSYSPKVWHKTYPLCDVPFSRSAMRTFTPAQKISSKSPNPARFSWRPKHYPVLYEHTATATRKGKRKEKRKGFFVFLFGE